MLFLNTDFVFFGSKGRNDAPRSWKVRDDACMYEYMELRNENREYTTFFLSLRRDEFHGQVRNLYPNSQ